MTTDIEFVDLVALRPIRRKDGTKAVRMPDGTLLEVPPVRFWVDLGDGKYCADGHHAYLWRLGFVIALLDAGYKVISAENHVLAVTRLPVEGVPLTEGRLLSEAINARSLLPFNDPTPPRNPAHRRSHPDSCIPRDPNSRADGAVTVIWRANARRGVQS